MISRLGIWLTIATIAWGAFAFGAVYPWAYRVLAGMSLMVGAIGLLGKNAELSGAADAGQQRSISPGLVISLFSVAGVAAMQLVPIRLRALAALNPNGVDLLQRLDVAFALNPEAHALSVWPPGTCIALVLFGSFAVLLMGAAKLMSVAGPRRLVEILIITGVMLALVGIVQEPLYAGKVYGFWTTQQGGRPFGPFVNKNHFAGWMVMVLPVALGYLCASLAKAMRGVKPEWHDRLLWFSSPDANKLIMAAMGIAVMGLALVLTLSRSGISALALALAITGWFALRRLQGRSRIALAGGYLVLLAALIIGWVGVATVVTRFSDTDWREFNGRWGAWTDAGATFKRHWLTGTGLNTYQITNVFYQQHDTESFTSSAHNDYLQLAAEGGVILVVVIASCILLFIRDVRRRFTEDGKSSSYWLRAGAATGLLAIAFQETVEFSLQMPGNAALFAVICAIALHKAPHGTVTR